MFWGVVFCVVVLLGENVMDEIIQFGPFTAEHNLLLLSAWFDTCTEKVDTPGVFEDVVGRLIDHIDCTNVDSNFIDSVLGKPGSRFSNSERCR